MDIKKVQKDIVYFTENVLGIELNDWQRELIRKHERGEDIIWLAKPVSRRGG